MLLQLSENGPAIIREYSRSTNKLFLKRCDVLAASVQFVCTLITKTGFNVLCGRLVMMVFACL